MPIKTIAALRAALVAALFLALAVSPVAADGERFCWENEHDSEAKITYLKVYSSRQTGDPETESQTLVSDKEQDSAVKVAKGDTAYWPTNFKVEYVLIKVEVAKAEAAASPFAIPQVPTAVTTYTAAGGFGPSFSGQGLGLSAADGDVGGLLIVVDPLEGPLPALAPGSQIFVQDGVPQQPGMDRVSVFHDDADLTPFTGWTTVLGTFQAAVPPLAAGVQPVAEAEVTDITLIGR